MATVRAPYEFLSEENKSKWEGMLQPALTKVCNNTHTKHALNNGEVI